MCEVNLTYCPSVGEDAKEQEISRCTAAEIIKWYRLCGKVWHLKKLDVELPQNPAIAVIGTYPREIKTHVHTYKQMVTVALFKIVQKQKQAECPLTDK